MTDDQVSLARCAQINFENLEREFPFVKRWAFYRLAKAQLDESLGGASFAEVLAVNLPQSPPEVST